VKFSNPVVIAILLALAFHSTAQSPASPTQTQPEVYLIGSSHRNHFLQKYRYSLVDLGTQIQSLRPDVICGEITPEAYGQVMEGYFPPEAAYLAEMSGRWNTRFIPSDWRMDSFRQAKAEEAEPAEVKRQADELTQEELRGFEDFKTPSLYDYIHSPSYLERIDTLFEKVIGKDTVSDVAAGDWHERNRRIVQNCLTGAGSAHRIVFVFGVSHLPQLMHQLKARGITAQISPRAFAPSGLGSVPEEVVARWQRNRDSLQGILSGNINVSADALNKVERSSRIKDLDFVMHIYAKGSSHGQRTSQ